MTSAPAATRYTGDFVRRHLAAGARDVLEVGCGAGELAEQLQLGGLRVLAVDSDPSCVGLARQRGVEAQPATWPADLERKFDAVLFTRSLHHIHPLDEAVATAVSALRPGGVLIVEDFRAEGGSDRSSGWFRGLVRLLAATGAFCEEFDLEHTLAKLDVRHEEHELHSSVAIGEALRRRGTVEEGDSASYFRYVEANLRSSAAAEAFLEHELELISAGAIDPLGKRFVLAPDS